MAQLSQGTWVVVTDSEKALFMRNVTDHENPNLEVIRLEQQDNPPAREQAANRPGRKEDTAIRQRSAMEDTDWHELAKERFAADLADILYGLAHKGEFDRLVLVAAPQVLGALRNDLHKEVADRVVAEIPKNLANHPVDRIERLLRQELDAAG